MDWSTIASTLSSFGLTALGTALGGPAGGAIGSAAGKMVADALGVPATPEAVAAKLSADPELAKAQLAALERSQQAELAEMQARLADTQNARQTTVQLAENGSPMAWGAPVVSTVVITGFVGLSFLAMKPEMAGVRSDVVLYLLGAWQSLATAVVAFWVGSSAGSKRSGDAVRAIAIQAPTIAEQAGAILGKAVKR